MKTIATRHQSGAFVAADGDGNRHKVDGYDVSYSDDSGHKAAAIGLCRKMAWSGTLHGGHVMKGGKLVGMVWVFEDKRNTIEVKGCVRCK